MPLCLIQADEKYHLYNMERIIQKQRAFRRENPLFCR